MSSTPIAPEPCIAECPPALPRPALSPLGDGISSLELIRISGSDLDIINAARVSYGKIATEVTQRDITLINFLMEHNHTSPFEHNQLSFRVKAPIYVTREWMRHRMNSFNEISYRYAKANIEFYIPKTWRFQAKVNKQASSGSFSNDELKESYTKTLELAYQTYEHLLSQGVSREQARGVLPVCIYTEFIYTCNLHSLMHFLRLRLDPGAQQEIRAYAYGLFLLAEKHFPVTLGAWTRIHMPQFEESLRSIDFITNFATFKENT